MVTIRDRSRALECDENHIRVTPESSDEQLEYPHVRALVDDLIHHAHRTLSLGPKDLQDPYLNGIKTEHLAIQMLFGMHGDKLVRHGHVLDLKTMYASRVDPDLLNMTEEE